MEGQNGSVNHKDSGFDAQFKSHILPRSTATLQVSATVRGLDFNDFCGSDLKVVQLLDQMANTGFQASNVVDAVNVVDTMRSWPANGTHPDYPNQIFLGYTSNLVSSGVREQIRWLVEHKCVTALVTTAGGVEEDIIKCFASTYRDTFDANDAQLYAHHINRIGNLRVPNDNYVEFEDWVMPILSAMFEEQEASLLEFYANKLQGHREHKAGHASNKASSQQYLDDKRPLIWTPSTIIARLGKEINHPSSICYWAYKNSVPIFCPALTDGSLGDMISAFLMRQPSPQGLIIDIAADINRINAIGRNSGTFGAKMGAIILGGGLVKHHIMNACLQGGGADAAVYVNTASEFDGSDAGARTSEAVSWGKLKAEALQVKVCADASIVWPIIVAGTWARRHPRGLYG